MLQKTPHYSVLSGILIGAWNRYRGQSNPGHSLAILGDRQWDTYLGVVIGSHKFCMRTCSLHAQTGTFLVMRGGEGTLPSEVMMFWWFLKTRMGNHTNIFFVKKKKNRSRKNVVELIEPPPSPSPPPTSLRRFPKIQESLKIHAGLYVCCDIPRKLYCVASDTP